MALTTAATLPSCSGVWVKHDDAGREANRLAAVEVALRALVALLAGELTGEPAGGALAPSRPGSHRSPS